MGLIIKGKNIEVPVKVKDYIEKRVDKFDRHLSNITETKVELSEEKTKSKDNRYIVEITIDLQGMLLRSEERAVDMFSAVDIAVETMDRQILRYKEKLQGRKRRKQGTEAKAEVKASEAPPEEEIDESRPVKVKRFAIKPMSPDEAIDQMELIGHDFYVFFNDRSEQVNVVYRRKGSGYGLIEPELD
ncbi:MAG: ribosome-associated translation inhibitor RaiA [Chloroflexi bacterium]|nr:ribosome-associated translation inhibitor RaiA [Chloroflexota bacterium]